MSFFEGYSPRSQSSTLYRPPIWTGPSEHSYSPALSLAAVVGHTEEAVLFLGDYRGYRNGFELSIHLVVQAPASDTLERFVIWHPAQAPTGLRFGFALDNGRRATNLVNRLDEVPRGSDGLPSGPVALIRTITRMSASVVLTVFGWPSPHPGTLTVVTAFDGAGMDEHYCVIPASIVERGADGERSIWEGEPN